MSLPFAIHNCRKYNPALKKNLLHFINSENNEVNIFLVMCIVHAIYVKVIF